MSVNVFGDLPQKNHTSTGGDEAVFSLWSVEWGFFSPPNNCVQNLIPNKPKRKRRKSVSLLFFSHPVKCWASLVIYCGGTDIFFGSPKLVPLKGRFWMTELAHNSPFGSASAPPTFSPPQKRGRDLNNRSPNLKSEPVSLSTPPVILLGKTQRILYVWVSFAHKP